MTPLLPCPHCSRPGRPVAPVLRRGPRSGKIFLDGCDHAWALVNYTCAAADEAEAATRWNAWTGTQSPPAAATK